MIPFVLISGEVKVLFIDENFWSFSVWFLMIVAGIFVFSVNIAIFLQIKYTTPITNNIIGSVKSAVLVMLALITFRNPITFMVCIFWFFFFSCFYLHQNLEYSWCFISYWRNWGIYIF